VDKLLFNLLVGCSLLHSSLLGQLVQTAHVLHFKGALGATGLRLGLFNLSFTEEVFELSLFFLLNFFDRRQWLVAGLSWNHIRELDLLLRLALLFQRDLDLSLLKVDLGVWLIQLLLLDDELQLDRRLFLLQLFVMDFRYFFSVREAVFPGEDSGPGSLEGILKLLENIVDLCQYSDLLLQVHQIFLSSMMSVGGDVLEVVRNFYLANLAVGYQSLFFRELVQFLKG